MTFKTKIVCTIFCLQIFAAVHISAQNYFRAIDSLEWMPQVDAYGQNSFVGVGAKQLIKIDSNGNLYNCKQIKNSNPLIWEWGFLNFIQNPDSSTIFVGSYTLWPSDAYNTFFAKFDSRDSLVFSKTTVDTNSFYGYDELKKVIATADGNWLTAGDQIDNSNVQGDANLVLTKIDTSGNALWSYRYGSQSDVAINFRDAVELPNGDFFILIVTHYEYYYNVGIIKISSTGQVNSFTVFNYPGIWEFGNVKIIAVQNNLVYCLVYGAICCFDFNGNNQWFKKLKAISAPDISPAVINDALLTPAGDFYVSGSTVVFNNDSIYSRTSSNFFLARLNASAQPMWMKKYGTCADEQGVGMALRGDGNLLVFGTTYRPNYFGEAILQTDSSGTSPCYYIADTLVIDTVLQLTGVTYPIPARNAWPVQDFSPFFMQNVSLHVSDYCSIPDTCLQVAIYDRVNEALSDLPAFIIKPNPATDFCTLHISPHNGLLSAQVIDFTGRKVLDLFTRSEASDFDFNIKSLAAGIYFLNISDEHGQHAAKKLVKVQ